MSRFIRVFVLMSWALEIHCIRKCGLAHSSPRICHQCSLALAFAMSVVWPTQFTCVWICTHTPYCDTIYTWLTCHSAISYFEVKTQLRQYNWYNTLHQRTLHQYSATRKSFSHFIHILLDNNIWIQIIEVLEVLVGLS